MPKKDLICVCGRQIVPFLERDIVEYVTDWGQNGAIWEFDTKGRDFICLHCGRMYLCCGWCTDTDALHDHFTNEDKDDDFDDNVELCQFIGCPDSRGWIDSSLNVDNGDVVLDNSTIFPKNNEYIDYTLKNVDWIINEEIKNITGDNITGSDGGAAIFWKCRKCNRFQISCDK